MDGAITVERMIEPCDVLDAETPCDDVDAALRLGWETGSILVRSADGSLGLLSKGLFLATMAGRYGYGRSLWGKRPVGALALWGVTRIRPHTTITEAAALLVDGADGYRDLPVVDDDGAPIGLVRPVRLMRALADHTAHRAATDQLTGVASRARFLEELQSRLKGRADVGATPASAVVVAFLDLDRLKPVNDMLGHSMGDALLRSVARRLGESLGPGDVLGRLGGDEFAVLTSVQPQSPEDLCARALAFGERLRAALARRDPELPAQAESRASIGVAPAEERDTTVDDLLVRADQAMYAAKAAGGDRVRVAGRCGGARALETDDLLLVYQPVVDTGTGELTAVEALLRARLEDGRLEFPAGRFDRAARAGLTAELDRWVLARACADMMRWSQEWGELAPARVHVNLAPETVTLPGLAEMVIDTIAASGLEPGRVCLELSEYAGVDDLVAATGQLTALSAAGIGLALDDMGATLGALRLLGTAMPIDCVKVDRSVIAGCGRGSAFDAEMLALVARLAGQFGVDVVAEGVETELEDAAVLRGGVSKVQGFLHSVPLVEADLRDFAARCAMPAMVTTENGS